MGGGVGCVMTTVVVSFSVLFVVAEHRWVDGFRVLVFLPGVAALLRFEGSEGRLVLLHGTVNDVSACVWVRYLLALADKNVRLAASPIQP